MMVGVDWVVVGNWKKRPEKSLQNIAIKCKIEGIK